MRLTLAAVAALLSAITVTAQVQSPSAEAGRITGHVVTGYAELVADATVTVARVSAQAVSSQARTTRTDSTGSFRFAGLPAGSYRLSATKPGYTSRQITDGDVISATFEVGPVVDLAANAHADVQVVVRRTARIAGRIIRPDGSAAPDTRVGVAPRSRLFPLFDTMTTSQYDGRYEVAGLPPGEYVVVAMPGMRQPSASVDSVSFQSGVRASTTGASPPVDRTTWYPGVADGAKASSVTVLEGIDTEGIDIWLTPAQRFNVSGRVFWPVGTLAENIAIDYGDPAGTSNGVWLVSDPGGLFTIAGIAPGSLTLLVRADSSEGTLIGMASTEVTMDSVEDVRIIVDRPGRIAGRIVYEGNVPSSGRATSIVAVQKLLKVSALYPVPESTVDSSGRFVLPGLVGEYEFALDGLQQGLAIKRVRRNGRPLPTNRIGISGGEDFRDIEIVVGQ
jgi:hypothetical protein